MKRTIVDALQTVAKLKQELNTTAQPASWVYDMILLAEKFNIMYHALQTIGDPMGEIPKAVVREPEFSLGIYYEELAREALSVVNGKYEKSSPSNKK